MCHALHHESCLYIGGRQPIVAGPGAGHCGADRERGSRACLVRVRHCQRRSGERGREAGPVRGRACEMRAAASCNRVSDAIHLGTPGIQQGNPLYGHGSTCLPLIGRCLVVAFTTCAPQVLACGTWAMVIMRGDA